MLRVLKQLFGKRMTPDGLIRQLQRQAELFDEEQAGLNFQLKRQGSRVEAILNRGKEAARNGDSLGKRAAAIELKGAQLESAAVEKDLMRVLNARTFVRLTLRKLDRCTRSQLARAYEGLSRLMKEGTFMQMMVEARYEGHETEAKIGAALDRVFEELPEEADVLTVDTSIFDELAKADEAGDVAKVQEIKRRVGARNEPPVGEAGPIG